MTPHYRPSVIEDVYELAPKLRQQDKDEVMASGGFTALEALLISFNAGGEVNSMITEDGECMGMFGVSPTQDPLVGIPWMLASPKLPKYKRLFLPQSRDWVITVNQQYPMLINYVDARNDVAMKWLRFLGFTFINRIEEYGVGKKPFYEFVRINDV